MKKFLNILAAMMLAVISTSCLESNLEELEVYSGCEVTQGYVYWRWITDDVHPGSEDNYVKQTEMTYSGGGGHSLDKVNQKLIIRYHGGYVATSERPNINASKLVVALQVSTAAFVKPVGDAPALGVPGDWTKEHQYDVIAADGTTKRWTIGVLRHDAQ